MSLPPLVEPGPPLTSEQVTRWSRHVLLPQLGDVGQRRLRNARVCVVGAGGLGAPVLLYLAAAGVGTLGVVDHDEVELSNLQRQVLHGTADVGRPKVESARDAVGAVAPDVDVVLHPVRLDETTVDDVLRGYDLVIDGTDNFPTRYLVNDACVRLGLPEVWASVYRFDAQVSVFWGRPPAGVPAVQLRDLFPAPPPPGSVPSCAEGGVLGAVCGQVGSVMAAEAVKLVTGTGEPLLGRVLVLDALAARWSEVPLRGDVHAHDDVAAQPGQDGERTLVAGRDEASDRDAAVAAAPPVPTVSARALAERLAARGRGADAFTLVDVREPGEREVVAIPGAVAVPFADLLDGTGLDRLPADRPVVLHCRSGVRSERAARPCSRPDGPTSPTSRAACSRGSATSTPRCRPTDPPRAPEGDPVADGTRTVDAHRRAVLGLVAPLPALDVPVGAADGLVLAADVRAPEALPRWDNSAMDGYAVRADDVAAASEGEPVRLTVLADLPAGSADDPAVLPGTAARIMTGAPVPPGADAVVPVERTDARTDVVAIRAPAAPGAHVRRAGEDVAAGELVLAAGTLLGPTQVAAAASVGCGEVTVHRRPRVAVLSTGSELVAPGAPLARGQIPDSNSFLLAASVRAAGCDVVRVGAVPDEADALREVLPRLDADGVDLVVTSGGVSMGAYDVVKEVLAGQAGMEFVQVAMQPGKPQGLGRLPGGTPVLALPGNPVSASVSFEVFVRPALRRLRGLPDDHAAYGGARRAVALEGWASPPGREQYMPVVLEPAPDGGTGVRPAARGGSGSHLVASLARAQALAVVPADVDRVEPGDRVHVMRADR